MGLGLIERLKLKAESERRCYHCHYVMPGEIPSEQIHYCGKCGAPLKLDTTDATNNTYRDYIVVEKKEFDRLNENLFQCRMRIKKLEEELYYLKAKYGSFWSTLKAAFRLDYE